MHARPVKIRLLALPLVLSACGSSSAPVEREAVSGAGNGAAVAAREPSASLPNLPPAMSPPPAALLSCSAEIGAEAAAQRVRVCRNLSPATHPPCNAANSCALIEDEIARSCALFDQHGPTIKGCGSAPASMQAAANVVRRYYSAVNARDYATAWSQWGDDGRPGQTFATFKEGFADTRSARVTIGRLEPGGGGAGSIYQPVPVTIDATLADGTRQRFSGTYVLRRVNGVDGASPSQRRWHIDSAKLHRVAPT